MADREYNGWTNWHTWAFALWIDNSEQSHHARMFLCRAVVSADESCTVLSKHITLCAKELLLASGCTDDVDLGKVNFDEIADHWIEDVEEPETEYDRQQREDDEAGDLAMRFDKEHGSQD
jgi:hypothetical protein